MGSGPPGAPHSSTPVRGPVGPRVPVRPPPPRPRTPRCSPDFPFTTTFTGNSDPAFPGNEGNSSLTISFTVEYVKAPTTHEITPLDAENAQTAHAESAAAKHCGNAATGQLGHVGGGGLPSGRRRPPEPDRARAGIPAPAHAIPLVPAGRRAERTAGEGSGPPGPGISGKLTEAPTARQNPGRSAPSDLLSNNPSEGFWSAIGKRPLCVDMDILRGHAALRRQQTLAEISPSRGGRSQPLPGKAHNAHAHRVDGTGRPW